MWPNFATCDHLRHFSPLSASGLAICTWSLRPGPPPSPRPSSTPLPETPLGLVSSLFIWQRLFLLLVLVMLYVTAIRNCSTAHRNTAQGLRKQGHRGRELRRTGPHYYSACRRMRKVELQIASSPVSVSGRAPIQQGAQDDSPPRSKIDRDRSRVSSALFLLHTYSGIMGAWGPRRDI